MCYFVKTSFVYTKKKVILIFAAGKKGRKEENGRDVLVWNENEKALKKRGTLRRCV